jgi:hypothetical protein
MKQVLLVEVEVTLRLTVSQSLCLGIEYPCGTFFFCFIYNLNQQSEFTFYKLMLCDQILFPVIMLLYEICGLVSIGHPL